MENYARLQRIYGRRLIEERQAAEKQYPAQLSRYMRRQTLTTAQENSRKQTNEDEARSKARERLVNIQNGIPEGVLKSIIESTQSCFLIPPNFNDTTSHHDGLYVSHSSSAD
jgi:hypothetical protein